MAIVYRHIRLDDNTPFYIGIGVNEKRAFRTDFRNRYWKHIAEKGYEVEILFDDLSWEQACEKEKEFILLYGRKDLGTGCLVNMTDGGDGGFGQVQSEETRIKKSNSLKGKIRSAESKLRYSIIAKNRTYSEEVRKKMSETRKGRTSPRKGVKLSEETKLKISETKKLKKLQNV